MVSAQVPSTLRFYRKTSTGSRIFLFGSKVAALGPSGSSEGVVASTQDTWGFVPIQNANNKILNVNDQLVATLEVDTAATIDASDSEFILPITLSDGSTTMLGSPDNAVDWDVKVATDIAFVAGVETDLCIKKISQAFALGSNLQKAFLSIENNA